MHTIMGIDASLSSTGVAITSYNKEILFRQTIKTTVNSSIKERILIVHKEIESLINRFNVHLILVENNYSGGSKEVNWIIGIIYLIAAKNWIDIKTYAPASIKKVVTGNGKARKKEMKPAIHVIYGEIKTNQHVRDALGIIYCYFEKEKEERLIGKATEANS
ncbi:crossover junction endodeoxyribonuclease RuvC [Niallia circulans]|uniref:crossover junction endodeoxyribonuclease RuvC n=1 Tax=Niallia circulans TaxID=1397 RepID=UPI0035152C9D